MDVTTTAASGLQNAWRSASNFASAIVQDATASAGNDLPGDVVGLTQAGTDIRADLAVLKAGEQMDRRLLDILA